MTANKPRPPVRPRYGRVPGYGQRFTIGIGACPVCGQYPACDPPKPATEVKEKHCRDSRCRFADIPHLSKDCGSE